MTTTLIAILTSAGIATILSALVQGVFNRRKLGADATEVITKAASGVVADIRLELDRKAAAMDRLREAHKAEMEERIALHSRIMKRVIEEHEREMADVRTILQLHTAWDAIAVRELARLGVDLPPAPPILYPAAPRD